MFEHALYSLPAFLTALCLTIYWGAVVVKLVKLARKIGKDPNAMPREKVGQLMRVLWYPAIIAMLVHAWFFVFSFGRENVGGWLRPFVTLSTGWLIAAYLATLLIIVGTVITFVCWRKMGRSWRIGIDPGEKLVMISSGPYRYVRHPIYAIRIGMMICAYVAVPTWMMLITGGLDILLLQIEARREEKYMLSGHGKAYEDYMKSVGRFLPCCACGKKSVS